MTTVYLLNKTFSTFAIFLNVLFIFKLIYINLKQKLHPDLQMTACNRELHSNILGWSDWREVFFF